MKKTILLLSMIILVMSARAETAQQTLSRAVKAIHATKSISAGYTISSGSERTSGTITAEGKMFRIDSQQMKVWFDGKTQWTLIPSDGEVSIYEPTAAELQQVNPFAVIDAATSLYTASYVKSNDTAKTKIQLVPKSKKNAEGISKAVLTLNAKNLMPEQLVITMSSRSVVTINISGVKGGDSLGVASFRPAKSALSGYEVIDLR